MQKALYRISPFGERRADLRSAFHTAAIIVSNRTEDTAGREFVDMVETLMRYVPANIDPEETIDMAALAKVKAST